MAEIVVNADQFRAILLREFAADAVLLRKAALDACLRGERRAVQITNEKRLFVDGMFHKSWKAQATLNGAELRNDAPYAAIIEYGRRPGRPGPPVIDPQGRNPIQEWVHKKLVMTGEVPPEDEESVAFAIRRAIHVKGSPPHHILKTVFDETKKYFIRDAVRRLRARHR